MNVVIDCERFQEQFQLFREIIEYNDKGRPFVSFREGIAAVCEGLRCEGRDCWTPGQPPTLPSGTQLKLKRPKLP